VAQAVAPPKSRKVVGDAVPGSVFALGIALRIIGFGRWKGILWASSGGRNLAATTFSHGDVSIAGAYASVVDMVARNTPWGVVPGLSPCGGCYDDMASRANCASGCEGMVSVSPLMPGSMSWYSRWRNRPRSVRVVRKRGSGNMGIGIRYRSCPAWGDRELALMSAWSHLAREEPASCRSSARG